MNDKALGLLGLMRRANAVQIGEVNTGKAVRAGKAKLVVLADDASANARKRAEGFVYGRGVPIMTIPYLKEQISAAVGVPGCSMLAVTDSGFANALIKSVSGL